MASTSWLQAAKAAAPSLLGAPPRRMSTLSSRKAVVVAQAEEKGGATESEVENPAPLASSAAESTVKSDFKGGPFTVRSDMIGAVLGGALNVPFRLGSGALVKGWELDEPNVCGSWVIFSRLHIALYSSSLNCWSCFFPLVMRVTAVFVQFLSYGERLRHFFNMQVSGEKSSCCRSWRRQICYSFRRYSISTPDVSSP